MLKNLWLFRSVWLFRCLLRVGTVFYFWVQEEFEFFVFRTSWDRRGRVDCSSNRVKFILLLKLLFQIKNFSAQNWKCSKTDEFHGFDAEQIDISLSQIIKKKGGWRPTNPFLSPYVDKKRNHEIKKKHVRGAGIQPNSPHYHNKNNNNDNNNDNNI